MSQLKKIPMRMCVGCFEMKEKSELIRVVRTAEGEISLDLTGKKSGRGAYVCCSPDCLKKAQKGGKLDRAFSCKVSPEIYDSLGEQLETIKKRGAAE